MGKKKIEQVEKVLIPGSDWYTWNSMPKNGEAFLITTAGPAIDICWWDGYCFRDYFHKQKLSFIRGWKPLGEPAPIDADCDIDTDFYIAPRD